MGKVYSMTIEYKDSKRISALSSDVANTPTWNDSLPTATGWTFASGSTAGAQNAYAKIESDSIRCIDDSNGTGYAVMYDLGSALSNKWVIRFKLTTNITASRTSNQAGVAIGIFSLPVTTTGNTSQDSIAFLDYNDTSSKLYASYTNGQAPSATPNTQIFSTTTSHANGSYWWCEMSRDEGTTTFKIFSDSTYSTLLETETRTTSTTDVSGLRYFGAKGFSFTDATSKVDCSVSGIEVYDTVTSLTNKPTNVQDNSILVEKDTGKRYWFDEAVPYTDESITWDSTTAVNVSISGNTATATGSTAWDKASQSTQTWTPSDEPTLEFTVTGSPLNQMVGFGQGTLGSSYTTLDFGLYTEAGLGVYESGVQKYNNTSVTPSSSDTFKVTMDSNGLVKYWRNGSVFYTSLQTASGTYYAQFTPKTSASTTTVNYSSTTPATWTDPKIKTALTIDTVNYESTQSTASSRSLSFTVNAETDQHKMLIVGISGGGAALTVTGVTYAGVSMTALATGGSGSPYYSEYRLFYLLDPPTGTANITATQSTSTNMSIRFGLSVYGVKQSAPVGVASGRYATPNTLTQSITASVSGSWIISSIIGSDVNSASPPSNYYTVSELATLNLGTASYQQNGLDQSPTIGSASSPSFNYKHPANNNAQPVGMFSLVLEPYG